MTRTMMWGLIGGLLLLSLAGMILSQRAGQTPMSDTASAVIEPTATPSKTPEAAEEIATYRNDEFGFTVQYPKTVPCRDTRDGDSCVVDMSPRNLASIAVRDSVVYSLYARELSFSIGIEKKLPDFTTLFDLVQYRNEHLNDMVSDPPIITKNVQQFTWQGYPAVASDDQYKGEAKCTLYVERDAYLYMILYPYPCSLVTNSTILDFTEYDSNEQKRMMAIEMILKNFVFEKGGK